MTYRTEYAQSLIDDFADPDKEPHLAISVDMLDTGIDIPEVVNLVFFKPVRSVSKFWQMIGRGTRLRPDLFGPGEHKRDFLVFDFCQNFEFFNAQPRLSDGRLDESLTERLFRARLELIGALDREAQPDDTGTAPSDGTRSTTGLRLDTARLLQHRVEGMNLDNFLVRPHRRWVETYRSFDRWERLTAAEVIEIGEHLAALPSRERDDDEDAKRFDLLLLRIQLASLHVEPGLDRLQAQVRQVAAVLLEQTTIPVIRAQEPLLHDVAGDEWWVDATLPMLELVRRRLRGLVHLIDRRARVLVRTEFVDTLGVASEVEMRGLSAGTDVERFRARARTYLRDHENHVVLRKLRTNKQLTATDLGELERILAGSGAGGPGDIERARQEARGLGLFVRSLVGLDRSAAAEAFSRFLAGSTYSTAQIHFVELIVTHLAESGVVEARRLYEPPFTDSAPSGPEELFDDEQVDSLVAILGSVRGTATVA